MKFCWCTITVKSMEESLKFYQDIVGLKISDRISAGDQMEIVFMGSGETKVELIYDPNRTPADNPRGISLGFEVDTLDKQLEFVKEQGLEITGGPYQPDPSVRFFFIKDPNGISIQFVEQL